MLITTISIALNAATGFAVWTSSLSVATKVVISILLIAKCALFFYSAWMGDGDLTRKIGTVICVVLNVALLVFSFIHAEYIVAGTTAGVLIALVVWSVTIVFGFSFKHRKEE